MGRGEGGGVLEIGNRSIRDMVARRVCGHHVSHYLWENRSREEDKEGRGDGARERVRLRGCVRADIPQVGST